MGGSAAFRRFVRDELVPAVERRYRTTPERAIVGESLARLFVVETFLADPTLFAHYVAFDPSLWWDRGALADSAAVRLTRSGLAGRTLYLTSSKDDVDDRTARLAAALRAAAPRGLEWTVRAAPGPHARDDLPRGRRGGARPCAAVAPSSCVLSD